MLKNNLIITTARRGKVTRSQKSVLIDNKNLCTIDSNVNFFELFGNTNKVVCEIGFGDGGCLVEMALLHPEYNFLGIELYLSGVGAALIKIRDLGIRNIRIVNMDARLVMGFLPDNSLERLNVLFSDPWPKTRMNKRRLINVDMLSGWLKKINVGAGVYIATDDAGYQEFISLQIAQLSNIDVVDTSTVHFMPNSMKRPVTKFETKGLKKGNKIKEWYLLKTKNSCSHLL
jgi:tRNA (guanine-N7-)-methyltransferase